MIWKTFILCYNTVSAVVIHAERVNNHLDTEMNRKGKIQPTLFQTWSTVSQKPKQDVNKDEDPVGVIELCSSDEDELLCKALEVSLAQYEATKTIPSVSSSSRTEKTTCSATISTRDTNCITAKRTPVETLPGFDVDAGHNWIYPTNYPLREYQFTIVQEALFKNTIVILPTGLGKTFIAAVVMYNFFRWYPRGKIVFMAPTKPLVAQQIEACFNIMGIPLEESVEMTGTTNPANRKITWKTKRVFFITPHVMSNDLAHGICPAKDVKLLVFDEAHKAKGNYAYCQVVNEVVKYTDQFRVLALSATPGNDAQAIQQVLQNLLISHIEFRTENSLDIQPYTFERTIEKKLVKFNDEMQEIIQKVLSLIEPFLDCLYKHDAVYRINVAEVRPFMLISARQRWRQTTAPNMDKRQLGLIEGEFAMCITLSHAYEMLLIYGVRSFYNFMQDILNGQKGTSIARSKLSRNDTLTEIMDELGPKFDTSNTENIDDDVSSHPKLDVLSEIVRDHFLASSSGDNVVKNTRVMVFSAFRDSVVEITNLLNKQKPVVRAMSFTGQATASNRSKGITQKEQIAIVKQFRSGNYNTLVATCVGEEGLDIGDVDLIVCFDAYKSPVRTIQRMGRTGRKRQGRVVLLTTEGREEQLLKRGQARTDKIQKLIGRSNYDALYAGNPRMVPKGLNPDCLKLHMSVAKYHVTGKRKKKSVDEGDKDTSRHLMEKFLARHRKKLISESSDHCDDETENNEIDNSPIKESVKNVKCAKTKSLSKPCRITKKQRAALVLEDSSDDSELLKETFKIDAKDLPACSSRDADVESKSNNADDDWEPFEFNDDFNYENPVELSYAKENLENALPSRDIDADNFFGLDQLRENDFGDNGEYKEQTAIRTPPALTDVFDASKLSLSPINLHAILGISDDEQNISFTPVKFRGDSMGFQIEQDSFEQDFSKLSPVITTNVLPKRSNNSSVNVQPHESTSLYSTTQLIEMVQQDSIYVNGYTRLREKIDDKVTESHKNEIDEAKDEMSALFDLNFKFDDSEESEMEERVNPGSINITKDKFSSPVSVEKDPTRVSFNLNFDLNGFMETDDVEDENESDCSSEDKDRSLFGVDEKQEFSSKILHTSTPLCGRNKIAKTISPYTDSESFSVPNVNQFKRQVMATGFVKTKKQRKRRLHNEFLQTQAEVAEDNVTPDESEHSGLDEMDSSFIDDKHVTDKSMRAVYLQSVKDVLGPKRFKLQFEKRNVIDTQKMSQDSLENDSYQLDEFCVPNDHVEYTTSPGNNEISDLQGDEVINKRSKGSRRRIINVLNSSTEDDDAIEREKNKTDSSRGVDSTKNQRDSSEIFRKQVPSANSKIIQTGSTASSKSRLTGTTTTSKIIQAGSTSTSRIIQTGSVDASTSRQTGLDSISKKISAESTKTSATKPKTSSNFVSTVSGVAEPKQLILLIDSRELNGTQGLVSILRHQHKVNTNVAKLCGCDYVVSTRMGVERKFASDVANASLRLRLVDRIQTMFEIFDRTCLIIEKDRDKLGMKSSNSNTNYYFRLISAMLQLPIKILYSNSQEETASLLKELVTQEQTKGFGISVDVNLTKKEDTLCRMYQKIPGVSYVTALHLCKNFKSLQQVVNSSSSDIQEKAVVTEERANKIVTFLKHNFK